VAHSPPTARLMTEDLVPQLWQRDRTAGRD